MTDDDTSVFGCARASLTLPGPPASSSRVTSADSQQVDSQVIGLIGRISDLQKKLNGLRDQETDSKDTSRPAQLGDTLSGIIRTLSTLLEAKEQAAAALRHPVLDNSFPLSHRVQLDLVEIVRILVSHLFRQGIAHPQYLFECWKCVFNQIRHHMYVLCLGQFRIF